MQHLNPIRFSHLLFYWFAHTCQTNRRFGNKPTYYLNVSLHVFLFLDTPSIKERCSRPYSRIFSALPGRGKQSKKAELAKVALRNATTSRIHETRKVTDMSAWEGITYKPPEYAKITWDASSEPTYFPSSSLEKRKAAASVNSTFAHVLSSDVFVFSVYTSFWYLRYWFSFYLYPGKPS